MPDSTPPKQENALLNLLLNVLLPVTILSYCSKKSGLFAVGPKWALIIAVALPVGYQICDWLQRRKINAFSIIGTISVLLTGGLGLLELSAPAFAAKEAVIPLVLGIVFLWTHKAGKPLSRTLLMNPEMLDVPKIEKAIDSNNCRMEFSRLLWQITWLLAGSFLLSAVLNFVLAMHFLDGKQPGSEEYTQAIGRQTGWGFLVIGVPMMAFLITAFLRLIKGLQRLTGLSQDDLMLPR
ncbi:MAG: hypothetical protein KA004_05950 [Verrucomicrobiales bacterium]|nr:hypothetical protein [Verrucomicrobiales bacterium]